MHGEVMIPNRIVNPEEAFEKVLDAKIVQALETRPETAIPTGFAVRVASQVPARGPRASRAVALHATYYGQRTVVASLVVLAVMLVVLLVNHVGQTAIGLAV